MGGGSSSGSDSSSDGSGSGSGSRQDNRAPADDDEGTGAQSTVDDYAHQAGVQQAAGRGAAGGASSDEDTSDVTDQVDEAEAALQGRTDSLASDTDDDDGGDAGGGGGGFAIEREQFTDDPVPTDQADDIATFAQNTFAEGAIAERFCEESPEYGARAAPAVESRPNRFGGWDEFDPDNILRRDWLNNTGEDAGVTSDVMEVADMKGENTDSYRAFLTHYDDAGPYKPVDWEQAHSQMATFTFLDSMGVRVPPHTFDADNEYVAVASVEQLGRREIIPIAELRLKSRDEKTEFTNGADRDEFLDMAAVHMLAGNTDLHTKNVKIERDGSFHTFDLDRAGRRFADMAELQADAGKAARTAQEVDQARQQDFNIKRRDITDRAAHIAHRLENTGRKEAVVERARQYDRLFYDKSGESFASTFKHNIEIAAADYRQNQL